MIFLFFFLVHFFHRDFAIDVPLLAVFFIHFPNELQVEQVSVHLPLQRLHLRAHRALVRVGSAGPGGLLQRFEYEVFFEDGDGLHGCYACEDGEDLVVAG